MEIYNLVIFFALFMLVVFFGTLIRGVVYKLSVKEMIKMFIFGLFLGIICIVIIYYQDF